MISKYIGDFLKDFFTIFGFFMMIVMFYFALESTASINVSLIWQVIIVASSFTFFKYAFVNKYDLGKKAQLISFFVCSTLADILIILWMFLFSPGKTADKNIMFVYIIIILIVKGAVYAMINYDGYIQAKQLNGKLNEYKNISSE